MRDNTNRRKVEHTSADKARRKALRENLQQERPTSEELVASGKYSEPVPHGVVLDTVRHLGRFQKE